MDPNLIETKLNAEPRIVYIRDPESNSFASDEDSDDDSILTFMEDDRNLKDLLESDSAADYWNIRKLIKYIKFGNQTATLDSLIALKDFDLNLEINQKAILDSGGLEILINLIEVNDIRCRLISLKVLNEITKYSRPFQMKCSLNGLAEILVKLLGEPARDMQICACETLANIGQIAYTRKVIKAIHGVERLVDLIDVDTKLLKTYPQKLSKNNFEVVNVCRVAISALFPLSRNRKIVRIMSQCGSIRLIGLLLKSVHDEILISTLGTLKNCAISESFRIAIENDGLLDDIIRILRAKKNVKLYEQGCSVIEQCALKQSCRDLIRKHNFLQFLTKLLQHEPYHVYDSLLVPLTGAIWKCSMSKENAEIFLSMNIFANLVSFLDSKNTQIVTNTAGALYELVKNNDVNRLYLTKNNNAVKKLVNFLTESTDDLLKNVSDLLKECAENAEVTQQIDQFDGIRLLWSLLKNKRPQIQMCAAWALVPCLKNAQNSGTLARSFVGGLELVVHLLQSSNENVLAAICALIAEIAQDEENLGIISDHGAVKLLSDLIKTDDQSLREHLSNAIAKCCSWKSNNEEFGEAKVIPALVGYLTKMNGLAVHRTATFALSALSMNPFNCVMLHETKVVPFMLKMISYNDKEIQNAASKCLRNIRVLALETEAYAFALKAQKSSNSSFNVTAVISFFKMSHLESNNPQKVDTIIKQVLLRFSFTPQRYV